MSAVASKSEEQVMVIPTSLLREVGYFQGFSTDIVSELPRLLSESLVQFRPRGEMEQNPEFKQIIPYVLFRCSSELESDRYFVYRRGTSTGEDRLHAKWSIGVGGHICVEDASCADTYAAGMLREIQEEVNFPEDLNLTRLDAFSTVLGLINDDSDDVGRVHLGVVHRIDLCAPIVQPREEGISSAQFMFLPELTYLDNAGQLESWSSLALRALKNGH